MVPDPYKPLQTAAIFIVTIFTNIVDSHIGGVLLGFFAWHLSHSLLHPLGSGVQLIL